VDLQHRQASGFGGQTALVTGASRGLGREIARRLAEMGASVGVNYVSRSAEAESLVNEIRASGGQALAVQADVGEPSQVQLMTERVTAELGPVSLLVNNAGVLFRGTLESFDPADIQRMWRTNVDAVVHRGTEQSAAHGMTRASANRQMGHNVIPSGGDPRL